MKTIRSLLGPALVMYSLIAHAQVSVSDPWVRTTVPAQKVTGAFMQLNSTQDVRLVQVTSPVAGHAEIHEMTMDGGIMKMRPLPNGVELPAGKSVALAPGAYHVMLYELKQQIKEGDSVPLTLVTEGKDGKRSRLEVTATARQSAAPAHAAD